MTHIFVNLGTEHPQGLQLIRKYFKTSTEARSFQCKYVRELKQLAKRGEFNRVCFQDTIRMYLTFFQELEHTKGAGRAQTISGTCVSQGPDKRSKLKSQIKTWKGVYTNKNKNTNTNQKINM